MTETFFFDTYALIGLLKGSASYEKYKGVGKITSMLNLLELYYSLLKEYDEKTAERFFNIFLAIVVPYTDRVIRNAAKFRFANKDKKFSYVDCLGYMMSLENSVKFLTGDDGFKNMKNVEFVK